ncbi:hypothetical protein LCGC14_2951610, partial [marine sediment metagenome]
VLTTLGNSHGVIFNDSKTKWWYKPKDLQLISSELTVVAFVERVEKLESMMAQATGTDEHLADYEYIRKIIDRPKENMSAAMMKTLNNMYSKYRKITNV